MGANMRRSRKTITGGSNRGGEFMPKWVHREENHMYNLPPMSVREQRRGRKRKGE